MGKAKKIKKRIKDNQEAKLAPERKAQKEALEARIRREMEDGQYAEALEVLAELVQMKDVKPEFLYDGAYSYFMLGDYERAAAWVENVLKYDANHLPARILLARICILEDRTDDGLSVFEFVLKNGRSRLSEEDREEIEDVISYYFRKDPERVRREYPHIAEFMEHGLAEGKNPKAQSAPGSSPKEILQALRDKVAGSQESVPAESDPGQVLNEKPVAEGGSAREILQALRNKVIGGEKSKDPASVQQTGPVVEKEPKASEAGSAREVLQALRDKVLKSGQADQKDSEEPVKQEPKEIMKSAPGVQREVSDESFEETVQRKKQMILKQSVSLEDKVRLLNAFAGSCYYERDLAGAKELLTEALRIDSSSTITLKNLAYVLLEQGEKDKALELLTQSKTTDFALLRFLRDGR